jgi:3-isopropylmalate/(R)-2-methylmalate dehydratase small subunit
MTLTSRARVTGTAIVLPGNDIDTDRIMPARFLKAITFAGLEDHVFEDDRREASSRGLVHAFDDPARRQARVLLAGANLGCGSSREHAPQALFRWGVRAVVAESFAEIFFGNSLMIGLPCVTVSPADAESLRVAAADADLAFYVDLESRTVRAGTVTTRCEIPDSARGALLSGAWDATALLLDNYGDVTRTAERLPYLRQFS